MFARTLRFGIQFFSAIALSAASVSSALGATTTIFADGVSAENGWYNYKKGSTHHCWAANAANLVSWWQDRLAEKYVLPAGVPVKEDVWTTYHSSFFSNTGGVTAYAVEWWINGRYRTSGLCDQTTGGYYPQLDVPENPKYDTPLLSKFFPGEGTLEEFSLRVAEKLRSGSALAFSIFGYGKDVTVWGVELDEETSLLTKVYLTNPSWNSGWIETECWAVDVDGYSTPVRSYQISGFGDGTYVSMAIGLSTDIGDALPLIPEPSAAALIFGAGTLALAFSARRRRRSRGNAR